MDDKISIIVVTYNAEKYIERCIQSIINQTYKNIEIIIINDGSTDNTKNIINKYEGLARIYHKKNEGVSSARNLGISMCKTKYFMFVDSDDYLEPTAVSILYKKLIDTNSDIVMGSVDNKIKEEHVLTNDNKYDYLLDSKIIYLMVPWNKLYKTKIFEDLKFPNITTTEDEYLITYILQKINKMIIIPQKTYNYVINNNGLSSKLLEYYEEAIWSFRDRMIFFKDSKYNKKAKKQYMNYCIYLYNKFREEKIKKRDLIIEVKKCLQENKKLKYYIFCYANELYYFLYKIRGKIWKKYQ